MPDPPVRRDHDRCSPSPRRPPDRAWRLRLLIDAYGDVLQEHALTRELFGTSHLPSRTPPSSESAPPANVIEPLCQLGVAIARTPGPQNQPTSRVRAPTVTVGATRSVGGLEGSTLEYGVSSGTSTALVAGSESSASASAARAIGARFVSVVALRGSRSDPALLALNVSTVMSANAETSSEQDCAKIWRGACDPTTIAPARRAPSACAVTVTSGASESSSTRITFEVRAHTSATKSARPGQSTSDWYRSRTG